jgi:hypothetical protein
VDCVVSEAQALRNGGVNENSAGIVSRNVRRVFLSWVRLVLVVFGTVQHILFSFPSCGLFSFFPAFRLRFLHVKLIY